MGLQLFDRIHQRVYLTLEYFNATGVLRLLQAGHIDAGFLAYTGPTDPGMSRLEIKRERMLLALPE